MTSTNGEAVAGCYAKGIGTIGQLKTLAVNRLAVFDYN
jgi:hypothetical protein